MHMEWSKREWVHTWASSHNALSRKGIITQLMNTKYSSCISECKMKIRQNILSTIVDNPKRSNIGPSSKPNLLFMNWSPKFRVLELWSIHYCLCKIKKIRRLFKSRNGIKTIRVKTGFLEFTWKLEYWELNLKD